MVWRAWGDGAPLVLLHGGLDILLQLPDGPVHCMTG